MVKNLKIVILGGDKRQKYLCENLKNQGYITEHITSGEGIKTKIENSDIIILPLPATKDKITVFNTFSDNKIYLSDLKEFTNRQLILTCNYDFCEKNCIDYNKSEGFAIKNAIPTAEGAIALAVANSENMLFGSECLIIGFGRIGKILSFYLKSLGAKVTVSARKETDLNFIYSFGMNPIKTAEINKDAHKYDFVFNTVNSPVINDEFLIKTKPDALLVELASLPGGISGSKEKASCSIINAQGLPGKFSPKAAAKILTETVLEILNNLKGEIL